MPRLINILKQEGDTKFPEDEFPRCSHAYDVTACGKNSAVTSLEQYSVLQCSLSWQRQLES